MSEKKYEDKCTLGFDNHVYCPDSECAFHKASIEKEQKNMLKKLSKVPIMEMIPMSAYTELLTEARKLREALEIEMGNSGTRQAEEALSNFDAKYPEVKE